MAQVRFLVLVGLGTPAPLRRSTETETSPGAGVMPGDLPLLRLLP